MKFLYYCGLLLLFVFVFLAQASGSAKRDVADEGPSQKKSNINVIDSLQIGMSEIGYTICIDGEVVLTFDNDSIFACEWIDLENGDTISTERTVTLRPDSTHRYRVNLYYFTGELIRNGDFEDVSLPEDKRVDTEYRFVKTIEPDSKGRGGNAGKELWAEGTYRIGKSPKTFHSNFYNIGDHTSGEGNMMVVNGSQTGNTNVWKQTVEVEKGRIYAFSTWGVEVGRNNPAQFHFTINGKTLGQDFQLEDYGMENARWDQFYELWEADSNVAVISLVNLNTKPDGNDFAIDDISFASMKKKPVDITVKVLPTVKLGHLADVVKCEDEEIVVNAEATGTGITGYVWTKNGNLLKNTGALLNLPAAKVEDSGWYTCTVNGECGSRTDTFRMEVRPGLKIAKLCDTVQPCEKDKVEFQAEAEGYEPLFLWTKPDKSQGWEGGKSAVYVNEKIYWERDTGTYTCHISTKCGDTTVFRVLEPREKLQITDWIGDVLSCAGSDVRLFVETSREPITVSWSGPGFLKRQEGKELWLMNVQEDHSGVYDCIVWDDCWEEERKDLILQVIPVMTKLDVWPDTLIVCENGSAVFHAQADGAGLRYEWSGPGNFKARGAEIVIDPVTPGKWGTYFVTATDSCGNQKSSAVELLPLREYDDIEIIGETQLCPGENLNLEVAGGKGELTYEWLLPSGEHIAGSSLNRPVEKGQYICRVSGICPFAEKSVEISLKESLSAESGETDFRVCPGEEIILYAAATGTNVSYTWKKAADSLGGGQSFTLAGVRYEDAGIYDCYIRSDCGDTVFHYNVQLKDTLKLLDYSREKVVHRNEAFYLFTNVEGDNERVYEWFAGGKPVEGAGRGRLEGIAPDKDTTVFYQVRISGCNTLTVEMPVNVRVYQKISRDTAIHLCVGKDFAFKVEDKPQDWCEGSEFRSCWVFNGKDTVSYGNYLGFVGFTAFLVGDYVYTLRSDCGEETFTLRVDTLSTPKIRNIQSDQKKDENGVIIVCEGNDLNLLPEAEVIGMAMYEWSKDGVVIREALTPELGLKNLAPADEGTYTCRVISNECGEDAMEVRVKVYKNLEADYLPLVEKCPGESVNLQIRTTASVPSEFIWSGPGPASWTTESNGFSVNYRKSSVGEENEGTYQCRIVNVCGEKLAEIYLAIEKETDLPDLAAHDTLCPGAKLQLLMPAGQEGDEYSWTLPDQSLVKNNALIIENFSVADTGVYRYRLETKNHCFSKEDSITLHMHEHLQLTAISPDRVVCRGDSVRFVVSALGRGVEYEWWGPQGLHIPGPFVEINPVAEESCGFYEVVVTDACDKSGKRERVKLEILHELENLVISKDTAVCRGSDVIFHIYGGGEEVVSYVWKYAGEVKGDQAELSLEEVGLENEGKYICEVEGKCQTILKEVNLGIYKDLTVSKEEVSPVCLRDNAVLQVYGDGEKVSFRWFRDGREQGYQTDRLDLYDVIPSDTGKYECRIGSLCGDTTLWFDFQTKKTTRIKRHSADRILCEGDKYKLFVDATGEELSYMWKCDGVLLPEKDGVIERVAGGIDTLIYTCMVSGECGTDSVSVKIRIGEFQKIRGDYKDTVCEGSNYRYNVDVIPDGAFEGQAFRYRWTFKGKEVYDGESSVFPLTEVKAEDAGIYHCEIISLEDSVNIKKALIKVEIEMIRLPQLLSMTSGLYLIEGAVDSLKVSASGDQLTYSWSKDGELQQEDSPVWLFLPAVYEDRGEYEVTVANACSQVKGKAGVEVWKKTVVVFPQERYDSVCRGGDISMEVLAWGEVGLLYKWYHDGKLMDVPFTQPLNITGAELQDSGEYKCLVTGRGGADSSKIHLKVSELPHLSIRGNFRLCRDDVSAVQQYIGECDNESRLKFEWEVKGGEIAGNANWKDIGVKWDKETEGTLLLKLTSLTTGCSKTDTKSVQYNLPPEVNFSLPGYVGYCTDSLVLDRAYPWGGTFRVNGAPSDCIHFINKDIYYAIEYFYRDTLTGCSAASYDTVRIEAAPYLDLLQDTVVSGWCAPVMVEVREHSTGDIRWGGDRLPEITEPLRMKYQAKEFESGSIRFWAVLTDGYQCEASDTTVVSLLPSPVLSLGQDTVIGVCSELLLRGKFNAGEMQQVDWQASADLEIMDAHTARVLNHRAGEHQYTLTVADLYGCTASDTVRVTVKEAPVISGGELCEGDSLLVRLGAFSKYVWNDGYEGNERLIYIPGVYVLEVEDEFGCPGEAVYDVHTLPEVNLRDTVIYEGQHIDFTVEGLAAYPPYEVVWQDGTTGMTCYAEKEGYYQVRVTDNLGCTSGDTAFLSVKRWYIAAPDAFLPGSKGENAKFYLKEVNFGNRFEMYIYDRWGELLFKTNEIGMKGGWDGTFKGMDCQPGAYIWVAYVDGKEVGRGTLMLVK